MSSQTITIIKKDNIRFFSDFGIITKYTLYFLMIPFSGISQVLYWLSFFIGPILFIGGKKIIYLSKEQKRYFRYLAIFNVLILITTLTSIDYIIPLKKLLMITSTVWTTFLISLRIKTLRNYLEVLKGLYLASLTFTLLMFLQKYKGGLSFDFSELSLVFGKNSSAPIMLIGMVSSILLNKLNRTKIFLEASCYFFLLGIFFTGSIKSFMAGVLIYGTYTFFRFKKKSERFLFITTILTALIIGQNYLTSSGITDDYVFQRFTSRISVLFGGESTIDYIDTEQVKGFRSALISNGFDIFLENPFLGVGIENTRLIMGTYTHNTFVELLAGGGILTFVFFILAMKIVFLTILKIKDSHFRIIVLIVFSSIILIANAQRIYDDRILLFFISILVPLVHLYKLEKENV